MSSFTAPLFVEVEQGEKAGLGLARLLLSFEFYRAGEVIRVPAGFETDFCSIPWWARAFLPVMGKAAKAAVIHDYLLSIRDRPKVEIDRVFLEAMKVLHVGKLRRWIMYLAVRTRP